MNYKHLGIVLLLPLLMIGGPVSAAIQGIVAVPTSWRVENYVSGEDVVLWYTPSVCSTGKLTLPAGSSQALRNRFLATMIAAKTAARKVIVYYDDSAAPSTCVVASFGLESE